MDVLDLNDIRLKIHPFQWIFYAFGRMVGASQNVLDVVRLGKIVHCCKEGVILRDVDMRDSRFKERKLKITHLLPIDDLRIKMKTELLDKHLDVVDRDLGIPAAVDMKH